MLPILNNLNILNLTLKMQSLRSTEFRAKYFFFFFLETRELGNALQFTVVSKYPYK